MPAANALVEVADDANHEIVGAMCQIRARTIEGLAFKARVSVDHELNMMDELVLSIMDDIQVMAARQMT